MANMLIRKLESFSPLAPNDRGLIDSIIGNPRLVGPHEDLIREGEAPEHVLLITSGFAYRFKLLPDGTRQIFAYLLPGDLCDLHVFILDEMDHSIGTLSDCMVVDIARKDVLRLLERPAIARALWWATLVDEGILREALVNMGRRKAEERVAHFLCELLVRLETVGLVSNNAFELPITQTALSDTMSLSTVHINRVLQHLRGRNLITFGGGNVGVLDVEGLKAFSGFDPNYLHLGARRRKRDVPEALGDIRGREPNRSTD